MLVTDSWGSPLLLDLNRVPRCTELCHQAFSVQGTMKEKEFFLQLVFSKMVSGICVSNGTMYGKAYEKV